MKIGIGLPNHIANAPATSIVEWAVRAEERGFESVTIIDRLVYPGTDAIVALALAAGATTNLGLVTNILLAPLYPAAILAKQLGSLAGAAGERVTLGIAPGGREDDYVAAGVDYAERGRLLDGLTEFVRDAWSGEPGLVPQPVRVPILIGGKSKPALRRATTLGDGWVAGALRDYAGQSEFADRVRAGWRDAGRSGSPLLHASVNFAIGSGAVVDAGHAHLKAYYGFMPEYAAMNVADMLTSPQDARDTVAAYRELGFDRLLFHPTVASVEQVDLLADAVL